MLTRRAALPLAAAGAAAITQGAANRTAAQTTAALPERYDEPLGICLEGWSYPAPVQWHDCAVAGQPLRMAYMDVAPTARASGKTIVLMHGKSFDSSYWAGPIRDLAASGYRVVVPDQIGFHKSSKPDIAYSLDALTELTFNFLAGKQIGRFSLLAHSAGALTAVRLASAYPERVDRLILENPVGLIDYHRYVPALSLDTLVSEERRRTVASQRAYVHSFFAALAPAEAERFVEWRMRIAHSGEYERFCKASALTTQMVYRETVRGQMDDLRPPTLLIAGDLDRSIPLRQYAVPDKAAQMPAIPAAAAEAAKELRKGAFASVPGAGHVPHLEAPELFRKAMLDFLAA